MRIGSAPDTFFGAGHQAARYAIDAGRIGRVVGGAVCFAGPGMESWHPNPTFFFKRGGGPVLDIGCYPITQLVNCLGPVASVVAHASRAQETRTVTSEPRRGEVIEVEVPTTVNGVLDFANGANVALTVSWDIWKHARLPIELYGTEGSLLNPDPNFFGGPTRDLGAQRRMARSADSVTIRSASQRARTTPAARSRTTAWWACSTWPAPSPPAGRIAPAASWRCMCWRSWKP